MLRKKGFTLLELIIVIIVIGILASIALPRYMRVAEKGRTTEAKSILSALRSAQVRYNAQYSVYADNASSLDVEYDTPDFYTFSTAATGVSSAVRNDKDLGVGNYTITLAADGDMNITTNFEYLM